MALEFEWTEDLSRQLQNEEDCELVFLGEVMERDVEGRRLLGMTGCSRIEGPDETGRFGLLLRTDRT